ncbi:hypothetical protein G8770_19245 [Aestuariicella hydrocarbonica]|uniref:Transmembrane protein n=1 Tax=Pseudomaricurvus hydrocarbonicus TaxID=1470433 RepID=A0A9E5MNZ3_9GAMM|nr:hypothetical protein [Aestuariicella hydrocarbonica]NHO67688.1 hypothetical protein [Aestuariicella hydrocarbonica]
MGLLTLLMAQEVRGQAISTETNRKATRLALLFLGVIFLFPVAAGYAVQYKVSRMGYVYCQDQSHQWLHAQTKVFAVNATSCDSQ